MGNLWEIYGNLWKSDSKYFNIIQSLLTRIDSYGLV
jgi:hypothetical protein